nr:helix-turn-helix domain-containing protein [Mycobacterium sp. UM_NZ2]
MPFTAEEQVIVRRRAVDRLKRIGNIRAAAQLSEAGATATQIAERLGIAEPTVHRLQAGARVLGDVEGSPEEMILRAFVDGTDRAELVVALSVYPYTFPEYAPYPHEGKTLSTWDQVEAAAVAGFISRDEFLRIHAAVNPPPPKDSP